MTKEQLSTMNLPEFIQFLETNRNLRVPSRLGEVLPEQEDFVLIMDSRKFRYEDHLSEVMPHLMNGEVLERYIVVSNDKGEKLVLFDLEKWDHRYVFICECAEEPVKALIESIPSLNTN